MAAIVLKRDHSGWIQNPFTMLGISRMMVGLPGGSQIRDRAFFMEKTIADCTTHSTLLILWVDSSRKDTHRPYIFDSLQICPMFLFFNICGPLVASDLILMLYELISVLPCHTGPPQSSRATTWEHTQATKCGPDLSGFLPFLIQNTFRDKLRKEERQGRRKEKKEEKASKPRALFFWKIMWKRRNGTSF